MSNDFFRSVSFPCHRSPLLLAPARLTLSLAWFNGGRSEEYLHGGLYYKRKFGDFIIWKQILSHAKVSGLTHVIFITDDEKEDWFYIVNSNGEKTIGPRPELLDEISRESSVHMFYIYNSERFMRFAQEYLKIGLKEESISDG